MALAAAVLLAAAALLAAAVSARHFADSGRIAPGVSISHVKVASMTPEEAIAAVSRRWEKALEGNVRLTYPDGERALTRDELGLRPQIAEAVQEAMSIGRRGGVLERIIELYRLRSQGVDIPVTTAVDETRLRRNLESLRPEVDRQPRDASVSLVGERVNVKPGQVGRALDIEASAKALKSALADPAVTTAELVVVTTQPDITAKQLADLEVVLGAYRTRFNPRKVGRTHNLRLAVQQITKTVIDPGEVFSFNGVVGERAASRGFRAATIFAEGDLREELGGGMCQISSTVYNAVLLAGLDVVERSPHQRPVDYIPMGRDATVYWGSKDFKFRNTTPHSVMLMAGVDGDEVWVAILGKASSKVTVKLETTDVSRGSAGVVEKIDPSLPPGKRVTERPGSGGGTATLWREIYRDGKLIKRQRLHTDRYPSIPAIVRVGPKQAAPPALPGNEESGALQTVEDRGEAAAAAPTGAKAASGKASSPKAASEKAQSPPATGVKAGSAATAKATSGKATSGKAATGKATSRAPTRPATP